MTGLDTASDSVTSQCLVWLSLLSYGDPSKKLLLVQKLQTQNIRLISLIAVLVSTVSTFLSAVDTHSLYTVVRGQENKEECSFHKM